MDLYIQQPVTLWFVAIFPRMQKLGFNPLASEVLHRSDEDMVADSSGYLSHFI